MHWEGKSLFEKLQGRSSNRRLAARILQKSQAMLAPFEEAELKLENLQLLRSIAQLENDRNTLTILSNRIRRIEEQLAIEAANIELNTTLSFLDHQKDSLQEHVTTLSAAQVETELMLARQQSTLDSLKMLRMEEQFQNEKKEMQLREQQNQLELQESQIDLQEKQLQFQSSQRNLFIAIVGILALLIIGGYLRYKETRKYSSALEAKNEALKEEREKSDQLLLNILPAPVADELKNTGTAQARRYEDATVMFTDFKNFSRIAKSMSPELLVTELDLYFKAFDEIIEKYAIEKIKTIGDAYLCVGGLPDQHGNEPKDVVLAAFDIQALLTQFREERIRRDQPFFEARIGIHTGPLVAGVVGSRKFAYDIWGDTVNIAARMEANSEAGRFNISASTYEVVKDHFS